MSTWPPSTPGPATSRSPPTPPPWPAPSGCRTSRSRPQVACDSLLNNNIDGGDCGTGNFNVTIDRGSTATSLLVTVTDPAATRYFSQVFGSGDQALTRSAEAEYNLPIPLGSPLNFFGGDTTRTVPATPPTEYAASWPSDYTTRVPANPSCNVGTSSRTGPRPLERSSSHVQRRRLQLER